MMSESETPSSQPSLKVTKAAARLSCAFLLLALPLTPGYGSSLGMPWPFFLLTWGMMSVFAAVSFVGYFACKRRGEQISAFYVICPGLLLVVLLVLLNRYDIVRAILRYEDAL